MTAKRDTGIDDARTAFVRQLEERLEQVHTRSPRRATLQKDKRHLLAQLKKRLEATTASRDKAVEAYDTEIQRRKRAIERLEAQIDALEGGSSQDDRMSSRSPGKTSGASQKPRRRAIKASRASDSNK
jgi:hypothetical protein